MSCKFTDFIGIAQFGDLEESIHSEFAVGSRSLVFWDDLQVIMQWRYTPIQKRLLQHSLGTLMLEGQWRWQVFTGSVDRSCRRCRSKKKMMQLLHCGVLHWENKEWTGCRNKKDRIKSKIIVSCRGCSTFLPQMLWLSLRRVQLRKLLLLCGFTMFHSVFWLLFFSLLLCCFAVEALQDATLKI